MSSVLSPQGLPGAWKPGNPNPPSSTSGSTSLQTGNQKSSTSNQSTTSPKISSSPSTKKTLSGTTMNMRFMQRRRVSDEAELSRKRKAQQEEQYHRQQQQQEQNEEDELRQQPSSNEYANNEIMNNTSSKDNAAISTKELFIVTIATDKDMHGSDIIGRRSFGGFNKVVGETWEAAVKSQFKDSTSSGNIDSNKSTISDEDLVRRYKTYISGENNYYDSRNNSSRRSTGSGSSCRPIGNLDAIASKRKRSI